MPGVFRKTYIVFQDTDSETTANREILEQQWKQRQFSLRLIVVSSVYQDVQVATLSPIGETDESHIVRMQIVLSGDSVKPVVRILEDVACRVWPCCSCGC